MKSQSSFRYSSIPYHTILALFIAFALSMAQAQDQTPSIKVKIPFTFSVGNQSFAAGEYTLKALIQHTTGLQNQNGRTLSNISSNSIEAAAAPSSTELVFNRYNDHYFLAQIWEAGSNIGKQLIKSPAEVEMARATDSPAQQIALSFPHKHRR